MRKFWKKPLAALCVVVVMLCITACSVTEVEKAEPTVDTTPYTIDTRDETYKETIHTKSMFVDVEETTDWTVVYHQDTKVMYTVSQGIFTLLVNPDGTPMIWEG